VIPAGAYGWRLEIPAGKAGQYRLAQLDDYSSLPRRNLPWQLPLAGQPPLRMSLQARFSAANLPGTWGFGLWNDPFSFSLGLGGMSRRFPALPNAAWFFYASPQNYLSFRNDLPASGLLAATFSSPRLPAALLALAGLALPTAFVPPIGRVLRRIARRFVRQDAACLEVDPLEWREYSLDWQFDQVNFMLDGQECFSTPVSPQGRLGLVLWIDNQYAAWSPAGRLGYGFLANAEPAWLEIADFRMLRPER
jgi:hypothetical protein